MSKTWFDALVERVSAEEQHPHVLRSGNGRLLIAEHGARVLACELDGVEENLFFHTEFTNEDGSAGKVTGGDRMWVAPEIAYFWPTLEDALHRPKETAATPAEIDPAAWHDMAPDDDHRVELACGMSLQDMRNEAAGRILVRREVVSQHASIAEGTGLSHTSFSVTHSVELQDGADVGFCAGAWDILQVPTSGTLVCPTTRPIDLPDDLRSYYEPFGNPHVHLDERCVRFLLDGKRRIKAGLRPEHTTGRMGYVRALDDGRWTMIVRVFAPQPTEPYCDVPRDDPRNVALRDGKASGPVLGGDCFQTYNDDGDAFGGGPDVTFGEMEYHEPCVIGGEGPASRSGTSVTHVVVGPASDVFAFGEEMLGVPVEPLG